MSSIQIWDKILKIDSISIPLVMGYQLSQDINYDGGQFFARMESGTLKTQLHYNKFITTISATGYHAPPLAGLDRSTSHTVYSAIPRAIYSASNVIAIPAAAKRRSDTGYEPYAFGILNDGVNVRTTISIVNDVATLGTVTNVVQYSVEYYPIIVGYITEFSEKFEESSATWSWGFTLREI